MAARKLIRRAFLALPKNRFAYRVARRYADDFSGELNCDMETNGELLALARCIPRSGSVDVLDVGANQGDWTAAVLPLNPQLTIHAFEPCDGAFAKLTRRCFPERVRLIQLAMSDTSEMKELYVYGEAAGINSFVKRVDVPHEPLRTQLVEATTVDAYCKHLRLESLAFLKIDVEGHEFRVLRGAEKMLREGKIQAIQFEYGEGWIAARTFLKDALEWLEPFRYRHFKVTPSGLVSIPSYEVGLENFRNSNYLLLKP